ncbi:MAG TPA: hypothetical protein ENN79_00175 [Desulfobacteraceae bacterium]|nr:hypothetical protein [Desulfobacteraceae bacterium]
MIRHEYLQSPQVSAFISWLAARLDTPGSFIHSFYMRRTGARWECDSLFSAFQSYEWKFSVKDPVSGRLLSGKNFSETAEALTLIGKQIRDAISLGDHDAALAGCQAVLKWGGIHKGKYLEKSGAKLISTLVTRTEQLSDPVLDLSRLPSIEMNSGWSKIYSLEYPRFSTPLKIHKSISPPRIGFCPCFSGLLRIRVNVDQNRLVGIQLESMLRMP